MKDYKKSKIYKIVCKSTNNIYIGSTTKTLNQRLIQHKSDYKTGRNRNSKLVLMNDNFEIILVEDYPCNSKKELEIREGFYIRNLDCVNDRIAGRTDKEWRVDNKDTMKEYNKEWRDNNKDKLKLYRDNNKHRIKQYRDDNKDKMKQYNKQIRSYKNSWGGDLRYANNNLLRIDYTLFITN